MRIERKQPMSKNNKKNNYNPVIYYVVTTNMNSDDEVGIVEVHADGYFKEGDLKKALLDQEEFFGLEIEKIISEFDVPAYKLDAKPYLKPL